MTDEKNHMNVTEVLEKGISRKVVVVMEEENLRNVVEVLEKRNKRNAVVKERTIRPVRTARTRAAFFGASSNRYQNLAATLKQFQGSFHLLWQWSCFVRLFFIDLKKAFDTVDHKILLHFRSLWFSWCYK